MKLSDIQLVIFSVLHDIKPSAAVTTSHLEGFLWFLEVCFCLFWTIIHKSLQSPPIHSKSGSFWLRSRPSGSFTPKSIAWVFVDLCLCTGAQSLSVQTRQRTSSESKIREMAKIYLPGRSNKSLFHCQVVPQDPLRLTKTVTSCLSWQILSTSLWYY